MPGAWWRSWGDCTRSTARWWRPTGRLAADEWWTAGPVQRLGSKWLRLQWWLQRRLWRWLQWQLWQRRLWNWAGADDAPGLRHGRRAHWWHASPDVPANVRYAQRPSRWKRPSRWSSRRCHRATGPGDDGTAADDGWPGLGYAEVPWCCTRGRADDGDARHDWSQRSDDGAATRLHAAGHAGPTWGATAHAWATGPGRQPGGRRAATDDAAADVQQERRKRMSKEMPRGTWGAPYKLWGRFALLRSCGVEPLAVRSLPRRRPVSGSGTSPIAVAAPPSDALYFCCHLCGKGQAAFVP